VKDRGIALLAGLALLAAVSLLAVYAASGTLLQRHMATNFGEGSLAFENAIVAASFARSWLNSRPASDREPGCVRDCILPVGIHDTGEIPAQPEFKGIGWWRTNGFSAGYNPQTASTIDDPDIATRSAFWLIEEVHFQSGAESMTHGSTGYYRILSRGEGRNSKNVTVLEAIVARPWEGDIKPGKFPPGEPENPFCRQFSLQQPCGVLSWRRRR
jgi:Tfp pilus assembly protein PilX